MEDSTGYLYVLPVFNGECSVGYVGLMYDLTVYFI